MKLTIDITKDLRTFKEGSSYSFDWDSDNFNKEPFIYIVGENGSGKSTLVNCLRNQQCNNKDEYRDGVLAKCGYLHIKSFAEHCKISSDFTKVYFLSSEFDAPDTLNNAGSASSFVHNGGFQTRFASNGQRWLQMLANWINANQADFDDKTLIVFDEADKGFSLKYQQGLISMMNNMHSKYGVHFLVIAHNAYLLMQAQNYLYNVEDCRAIPKDLYMFMNTDKVCRFYEGEDALKEIMKTAKETH